MIVILGCGYTGRRVAKLLAERGHEVLATSRHPNEIQLAGVHAVRLDASEPGTLRELGGKIAAGARVLHSVPAIREGDQWADPTPRLIEALGNRAVRLVYLSTTGVYGAQRDVDENSPAAPRTPRERVRLEAENHVLRGPWSPMVLRPAAIYGPGRGIHVSMRRGEFRLLGDGSNYVSRIHVDDLAALAAAALLSSVTGAWPVADDEPARSREIAEFCGQLLGLPIPAPATEEELSETRRANRRVDGRAVREVLGIQLKYPSYRTGIPAALAGEAG